MNKPMRSLTVVVYAPGKTETRVLVEGILTTEDRHEAGEIANNVVDELASVPREKRFTRVVSTDDITDIKP